jgi:hypothetical protein
MPILNKDGTVYRLRGPHPLLKDQRRWDHDAIVLHNFGLIGTRSISVSNVSSVTKEEDQVILKAAVSEPPVITTPPTPIEKISTPQPQGIKIHCLPGVLTVHRDDLYGEEYTTIKYGNKFEFDANMVNKSDLSLILWTAHKTVAEGSILYPQTGHARWWRVTRVEPQGVGIVVTCIPSDEQPSFN